MLKIAVCDDEEAVFRELERVIQAGGMLHETDFYSSGESLTSSRKQYDLIFLDVDMRGMNGLETARILRKRDKQVKIVYLTAYEEYRDYAFSVHAFGYLVKPVKKESILRTLREAVEYTKKEEPPSLIRLETENGIIQADTRDLLYLEYLERKICIHTKAGLLWMKGSITAQAERLKPWHFSMPHKSFVVNLAKIKSLRGYEIELMDGSIVPLSQKKSAAFRKEFGRYLAEQL